MSLLDGPEISFTGIGVNMGSPVNRKKQIIAVASTCLQPLGYCLMKEPEFVDAKSTFFRKCLFEDIYGFVSFQLGTGRFVSSPKAPSPGRFRVDLWRNRGPLPHHGHGSGESMYENWLYMPLGQLMWVVLDVKAYKWQYHEWEFCTSEELGTQLQDALEKLVQYGIPWLEDPESRNPYSSWP